MIAKLPERRLRLAFFGTPQLARTILEAILDRGDDDVVLVVCQPDKPKGRGQKLEPPPVKQLADSRQIPVLQPVKMKDGTVAEALRKAELDLAIVAAFGRILPLDVLEAPRFGCWNVHASLLPRHRGASPIQHAILLGDTETGVTLMQMSEGLDEGPMLLRAAFPLSADDTAGSLSERVAKVGSDVVIEGLRLAKAVGLDVTPQNGGQATYAPIIEKEAGRLDLSRSAFELERRVRALQPWPGTWIQLPDGEALRVLRARATGGSTGDPGTVVGTGATLQVQTGDGVLELVEVQPSGKRPMPAADYLRGAGRSLTIGSPLLQR